MTNQINPETIERCQATLREAFISNHDRVYNILSNNGNTTSRKYCRVLCPDCPAVSAPMKTWCAWVLQKFPELAQEQQTAREREKRESEERAKAWDLNMCKRVAETGPAWRVGESVFKKSLQYVEHLLSQGYKPVKEGIGGLYFQHDERQVRTEVRRNRHLNAAVKYLQLTGKI